MKRYKGYDSTDINNLLDRYITNGGILYQVEEGCLGHGLMVLTKGGKNLKEYVIKEYYVNEWTSLHEVLEYKDGLPKKYLKMIENLDGYYLI